MESLAAYIPMDRRQAIAKGEALPEHTSGAALFADVSGFTPLTEALVRDLGSRRGAEELTRHLNAVYSALIAEAHRYGGSVVSFAGDAITCWFDGDRGLRATTCALNMQERMRQFAELEISSGSTVSLAIKAAVAAGPVRRFLVGDPKIQLLDVIAGATLDRMARTEKHTQKHQVVASAEIVSHLGDAAKILEWREDARTGERFAVVGDLAHRAETDRLPPLPAGIEKNLTEAQTRAWVLPPIYERLRTGQGRFLAELRPAVALFCGFGGLDYDRDDGVGDKLDRYIRWVQNVLARHESYLFQLITGDKGSYLYAAFGAPLTHGDDPARAVAAAITLRSPPQEMDYISDVQIGIAQGQMRAGAYGGPMRHTYGVLGDEVTIAARLMGEARLGEIWVSQFVADGAARDYRFEYLDTVPLKGKRKPMQVFRPLGRQRRARQTSARAFAAPLVGRTDELAQMEQILESALEGKGQILRLEGMAGVGKSHLAARFVDLAEDRGFQVATGDCQSTGQGAAYSCWRSVFRALFNLTDEPGGQDLLSWITGQVNHIQAVVRHTNLDLLTRLPLLGNLLELPIPDNPTTAALDPELRQQWLFAMVIELVQSWTSPNPAGVQAFGTIPEGDELLARLHQILDAHFSQGELRALCSELGLDYDALPGESKADRARELVSDLRSSQRIPELVKASRQLRPDIVWGPTPGVRAETGRLPHPLLLLIDDVQWMDEASRRLTVSLGWAIAQSPILIALVHRSQDEPILPELSRMPYHHRVRLGELPEHEIASVLSQRLHGELSPLALSLVQTLVQGNPFFAQELLDTLYESGRLVQQASVWTLSDALFNALRKGNCLARENEHWTLTPDARLSALELDIPDSIHSAVLSHIDRLREVHKLTLKVASVVGHTSGLDLLARSHPDRPDLEVLLDQVKELETRDLVRQRISRLGVLSCEFKSNIIREVTYGTLLAEQRRELHRAVGEALEQLQPDAVEPLAYHYAQSGVRDKAVGYLDRAARKTQREYANELALSYYEQALALEERWEWHKGRVELLHILGRREEEWAELEKLGEDPDVPPFDVAYLRGQYYEAIGEYANARDAIRAAGMACWKCGDVPGQVRCLNQVGLIAYRQGDFDLARTRYEEALQLIQERRDLWGQETWAPIETSKGLGSVYLQQGNFARARAHFERALAASQESKDRLSEALLLNHLGLMAFYQRNLGEAREYHQDALSIRREIGDRTGEAASLGNLALVEREMGNYDQAKAYLLDVLSIQQSIGDRWNQVNSWLSLGGTHQMLGDLDRAEANLVQGLELSREIGDVSGEAWILATLGLVMCDKGELAAAEKALARGLELSTEQDDKLLTAYFYSYQSLVSVQASRYEQAVERGQAALARHRELDLQPYIADDMATLATAYMAMGDMATSLACAREALAILDECGGEGPEWPYRDYFVCSQVLSATGEKESAHAALRSAYDLLMACAIKITDPALCELFLEQTAVNREIVQEYKRHQD